MAFLAYMYAGTVRGSVPPSVRAIEILSMALLVFVAWFVWIDRTRELRRPVP